MSWSLIEPCYGCSKADTCPDPERIRQAIREIHEDPEHCEKGGAGSIVISCFKRDQKLKE